MEQEGSAQEHVSQKAEKGTGYMNLLQTLNGEY
jgi:hypothetical protein